MQRASAFLLAVSLACLAARPVSGRPVGDRPILQAQTAPVEDVLAEFDRLAERPLWPGFEPRDIPLALYDGSMTWLVRHPDPPEPFRRRDLESEIWFMPGQHQAVRANSHATIGEAVAATLVIDPAGGHTARELAATLIHEAFHVYQANQHGDWFANELQLLSYPWEVPELIGLRRLEGEALRLALSASGPEEGACRGAQALRLRQARYARMPTASAEYERGLELAEGLATYVAGRALGVLDGDVMSGQPFAPDAVRSRAYASGQALAVLLDRYAGSWKQQLERATQPLDSLLAAALPEPEGRTCGFTQPEIERAVELAELDVAKAVAARAAARADYVARSGWRLDVVSHGEPLWPNGFDPLNMQVLEKREVLHSRWLKLGNGAGEIEVLNRAALTVGAGAHPLFEGVERVFLRGLPVEPVLERIDGRLILQGEGFRAEFERARVERGDGLIVIHLLEDG